MHAHTIRAPAARSLSLSQIGDNGPIGMSIERMILAEEAMRQLERALASERDEALDSDPSAKTLLAEVTDIKGADSLNSDVRLLAGARAELCGANAAAPFLALCDGDFLRETLEENKTAAPSSLSSASAPTLAKPLATTGGATGAPLLAQPGVAAAAAATAHAAAGTKAKAQPAADGGAPPSCARDECVECVETE